MKPDVWGVFHDGVVKTIRGTVPGSLSIQLEIRYLRRMFEEPGECFEIQLTACRRVAYNEYESEPTSDLASIQVKEPELLSVASENPLVLDCVMGTLELEYDEMSVALDTGRAISYQALLEASELYWNRWSESTKSDA